MWVRAYLQPVPGPKVKLVLGIAPADDINTINGGQHRAFPMFECGHCHLPLLPSDTMELGIGLTPYFLDTREEEGEDLVMPSSWAVKSAVSGLFKDGTKPVIKKTFQTWKTTLEDVGSWEEEPALNKFPDPQPE